MVRRLSRDVPSEGRPPLHEILCRLLVLRGHATVDAARAFLRPLKSHLHPPRELRDAEVAAERIAEAIRRDEMVVVHGDYDVDGISGSALLASWIVELGGRAEAIVPDRVRDGYDLSAKGVERAARREAGLLVTVDCGIRAHAAVREAVGAGMDVVVTDHHRPGDTLPEAMAVVNPSRDDCGYPNKDLCGAGVAFKVGQIVAELMGRPPDDEGAWQRLDLVALATIADQMPLAGENRALARMGLRAVDRTARPGLRALMDQAKIRRGAAVTGPDVAFGLAPRINAAGRVDDARLALRLLLAEALEEGRELARALEGANQRRRDLEHQVMTEALERMMEQGDPAEECGIVVAGEGWHTGVIGIVASRLVERVHRPVVVVSLDGRAGRGSGRSVPSFDLHGALSRCAGLLDRFGGHRQAAGLDVSRERLPEFRKAFGREARRVLGDEEPVRELRADLVVQPGDVDHGLYRLLLHMDPFGRGNPEPVLVAKGVTLTRCKVVHSRRPQGRRGPGHLKFRMSDRTGALDAIAFGAADSLGPVARALAAEGRRADVAFTLLEDRYMGRVGVKAKVIDVRAAG